MTKDTQEILRSLTEHEATPEGRGLELRLNVAKAIIRGLKRKGWSHADLARATSLEESFISRIVHSEIDCLLVTIGSLFHALDIKARALSDATRLNGYYRVFDDLNFGWDWVIDLDGGTKGVPRKHVHPEFFYGRLTTREDAERECLEWAEKLGIDARPGLTRGVTT
jgi:hypothetical protein